MIDRVVANNYKITGKIADGSFSSIYSAYDISSGKKVAVKVENKQSPYPQLNFEAKLYSVMHGFVSVPNTYGFAKDNYDLFLVMDQLGKNLEELLVLCGQQISVKTVLMLAGQMISAIEYMHKKSFIHNDIKPDNFLMGTGEKSNQIYLIDYGLSKKYQDPETLRHIPYEDNKPLTGTPRYASINALRGIRQTRRDDMESLAYVWIYLMKGYLPWMGINAKSTKQKYSMIMEAKSGISPEDLCEGLPKEFLTYLKEVRNLKYEDEPNYSKYREMFKNALIRNRLVFDYAYDWLDSRGRLISAKHPRVFPVFKQYMTRIEKLKSSNSISRTQIFMEITKESKREAIMQSDYDDDEIKSSEGHTLMDESDGPATFEAVDYEASKKKNKDNIGFGEQTMQLVPFEYTKAKKFWKCEETVDQRKPPFRLPVEKETPRWMRTRDSYK